MYKKIVPVGSQMSFPDIVNDVQDFAVFNANAKLTPFIKQYGIATKHIDGIAVGDELKPEWASAGSINFVAPGRVIFAENLYSILAFGDGKTVYNLDRIGPNEDYKLYLHYNFVYSDPTSVVDGFRYPVGTENTKSAPSYFLSVTPIASAL